LSTHLQLAAAREIGPIGGSMTMVLTAGTQKVHGSDPLPKAIERIEGHLSTAPIVLFMKGTPDFPQCGFSARVVAALRACNADFIDINVLEDQELREALKVYSQWPTIPQLYISRELIGGCDIVLDLYRSGELLRLVSATTP
jgi:monothiol glutaredoxin